MSEPSPIENKYVELAGPLERRATVRIECALRADCQPIAALEAGNHWPARATDISQGGINLRVSRRFEPGSFLTVQFTSAPADEIYVPVARVCHVSKDGMHWRLGCVWARALTAEDFQTLVGRLDASVQAA